MITVHLIYPLMGFTLCIHLLFMRLGLCGGEITTQRLWCWINYQTSPGSYHCPHLSSTAGLIFISCSKPFRCVQCCINPNIILHLRYPLQLSTISTSRLRTPHPQTYLYSILHQKLHISIAFIYIYIGLHNKEGINTH